MRSISGVEYDSVSQARSTPFSVVCRAHQIHAAGKFAHNLEIQLPEPVRL